MLSTKTMQVPSPLWIGDTGERHLICGSGGSRAILGSAGTILACDMAGLTEWRTIGGISGGSIPTLLYAAGVPVGRLLTLGVELDFTKLVTRRAHPLLILVAFLLKERFEQTRPRLGVMSSENLGRFIEELVPAWPKNYWTMAVVGRTQVLFTADGVWQFSENGSWRQISDTTAPLGLAIRASCAVPGIIDAIPFKGRHLFDGALSWDGQCPVGVASRYFGATPESIVACDVGEADNGTNAWAVWFWSLLCGKRCIVPKPRLVEGSERMLIVRPDVNQFASLQFKLTTEQKWNGVMAGFTAAVGRLSSAGLLVGERLERAKFIAADIERLKALAE